MSSQQTEALRAVLETNDEHPYVDVEWSPGWARLDGNFRACDLLAIAAALAQTAGAPPEDAPAVDGEECQHLSTTTYLNTDITVCMLCDEIVSKNAPPTPAVDGGDAVRKLRIVFDTMECERPAEQARKRLVGEVIEALAAAPAPAVEREAVKLPMRKPQLDIRNPKLYEPGGWDRAIDYNDGFNHALDLVAELNPTTTPAEAREPCPHEEMSAEPGGNPRWVCGGCRRGFEDWGDAMAERTTPQATPREHPAAQGDAGTVRFIHESEAPGMWEKHSLAYAAGWNARHALTHPQGEHKGNGNGNA